MVLRLSLPKQLMYIELHGLGDIFHWSFWLYLKTNASYEFCNRDYILRKLRLASKKDPSGKDKTSCTMSNEFIKTFLQGGEGGEETAL